MDRDGRLGSADHLYGLAAECALKAILVGWGVIPAMGPPPKSPYKVHIDKLWDEFGAYVRSHGHSTYVFPSGASPFSGWLAEHRYDEDSTFTVPRVQAHGAGSREAYRLFEQAVTDGVVRA